MADVNPFKETLLMGSFHVILPTGDVYTDLALSTKLYANKHYIWASSLLVPFLINYTLSWIAWFNSEKQKKFTWIAALLGCYPQLVAARIIWLFWTQPKKGVREKKHLERNLMENEIFTEAVPSSFIMTFLMMAISRYEEHTLIFGESSYLFVVTFLTSVLSAGLGLAKILKVGPCRVLAEGGCFGGLLAPRFLLIFAACLLSLLGKGLALASPFAYGVRDEHKVQVAATILSTMFLPGLLLGVVSCWHRGILRTVISHPSIVLLPAFTNFTFASSTTLCKRSLKEEGKEEGEAEEDREEKTGGGEAEEPFIVFSPKFTIINLIISLLAQAVYGISLTHIAGWDNRRPVYLVVYLVFGVPPTILGLLFTLLTLALTSTRKTCCSRSNCCCTCFTLPRVEYGALVVSKPQAHFVLGDNGKPKPVPEEEEVKREETEMVDNEEAKKKQNDEMVELVDNQAGDNLDMDMV
jgi:hypothetical protein